MAMKRSGAICLMATLICVALAFAIPESRASEDYTTLMKLITDNEDASINVMDLAFLLATHNFDTTPEDGFVILKLEGMMYSLIPNGEKPGLADVTIISNVVKELPSGWLAGEKVMRCGIST